MGNAEMPIVQGVRDISHQLLPVAGPWFFAGAEFVLLGALAPNIAQQLKLPSNAQGFILSCLALGHMLGCFLLGGPCGDLYGRVLPLRLSFALTLPACALCAFVNQTWLLALGAMMLGAVLGIGQIASIALCSEKTSPGWRLAMASSMLILFVFGAAWGYFVFFVFGAGSYTFDFEWRWLLMTGCLPLIVLLPISMALVEESGTYLKLRGQLPAKSTEARGPLSEFQSSTSSSEASGSGDTHIFATICEAYLGERMETTLCVTVTFFVVNFVLCAGFVELVQGLAGSGILMALLRQVPGICLISILGQWMSRASLVQLLLLLAGIWELVAAVRSTPAGPCGSQLFVGASLPLIIAWSAELYAANLRTRGIAASFAAGQLAVALAPVIFHILQEDLFALRSLCATLCLIATLLVDHLPVQVEIGENVDEQIVDKLVSATSELDDKPHYGTA